ncbi:hypothetical protein EDD86DRAFT_243722 [Gorgonomyces haynaldii]|nr:hypothetical protein EDD86DRAFT_243722 [Gorgonomyces haynaldii]
MLSFAFLQTISAYGLCDKNNVPPGVGQAFTIGATATKNVLIDGQLVPVTVSGTITPVDGCTFRATNVQITGVSSAYFYGGNSSSTDAVTLSKTPIRSDTPFTGDVTFVSTPGDWVSYKDFNEFRLYDPASKAFIGVVKLPDAPVTTVAETVKPSVTANVVETVPTAEPTTKQSSGSFASGAMVSLVGAIVWAISL